MQVEKKSMKSFSDRHQLHVPALRLQVFAMHRDEAFVLRFSSRDRGERAHIPGIRLLFPSASKMPA